VVTGHVVMVGARTSRSVILSTWKNEGKTKYVGFIFWYKYITFSRFNVFFLNFELFNMSV